jgi:hypothetical protein
MNKLDLPEKNINITGYFMGVYLDNGQPVLFELEGVLFLPIFSTAAKYEASIALANLEAPAKIQLITDHAATGRDAGDVNMDPMLPISIIALAATGLLVAVWLLARGRLGPWRKPSAWEREADATAKCERERAVKEWLERNNPETRDGK